MNLKRHWTPSSVGALIVITGALILRVCGINSEVWSLLLLSVGFLFGEQVVYIATSAKGKDK